MDTTVQFCFFFFILPPCPELAVSPEHVGNPACPAIACGDGGSNVEGSKGSIPWPALVFNDGGCIPILLVKISGSFSFLLSFTNSLQPSA